MDMKKFDLSRLSGNRIFNPELIDYEDSIDIIGDEIHSVRKSFVKIGWHLKHIKEKGTYQRDGYEDIFEFAHAKFKMSEGTVNRMINLCIEFSVGHDSPELDERYLGFDESQLFEMLPMKESERNEISPDMTVKQIREKKAENKAMKEPPEELVKTFLKEHDIDLSDYENVSDLKKCFIDMYGKSYTGGNNPCEFKCTPRGISLDKYDEITWLAFAKKAWNLKESEAPVAASEVQEAGNGDEPDAVSKLDGDATGQTIVFDQESAPDIPNKESEDILSEESAEEVPDCTALMDKLSFNLWGKAKDLSFNLWQLCNKNFSPNKEEIEGFKELMLKLNNIAYEFSNISES